MQRRTFLTAAGSALSAGAVSVLAPSVARGATSLWQPSELPDGALASGTLEALPGKVALIKRTYRPPNFETPLEYFRTEFTPNNAFFVRWHLAAIPQVNLATGD